MPGGIQRGMVAADSKAKALDKNCRIARDSVLKDIQSRYTGVTMQKQLNKREQVPGGVTPCQPDGGAWFYNDTLIAVFEGKKQQDRGNVIERWYKNNTVCRMVNPNVSYITFATGEGAYESGQIGKLLHIAHQSGYNKYNPGENSCFMNIEGFTRKEIISKMTTVLDERILSAQT